MNLFVRLCCLLLLLLSAVLAQFDSTIPSDDDEEVENSSTVIPKFISKSITTDAKEGDTVTFPCEVQDLGQFSIVWKKGKTHIFADNIRLMSDDNFVRLDDKSLRIKKIRGNYSGEYICVVSSTPALELTHYLMVQVRPRIQILPKSTIVVKQGHNVEANCNATGSPPPSVSWKRLDGDSAGRIYEGHILRLASADKSDSGSYECRAENGIGDPAIATLRVAVMYAPELELKANWVHSGIGQTTDLECTVYAEPPAQVTWQDRDGKTIKPNTHFITKSAVDKIHYQLRIKKVTKDDFGKYTCVANNHVGTTSETIEVSGLATPIIFKSNPSGDKPNSFMLTWETNSYSKVIEYLLKLRIQDDDDPNKPRVWTEVNIPAVSQTGLLQTHTYEVTGLQGATAYEAIMSVRNEFGWNQPGEPFLFSTEGKAVVPPSLEESSVMSAEQAHPDPQQADNTGNDADGPKKVRIFNLLTIIVLSFFF